jgi:hypothetical protein
MDFVYVIPSYNRVEIFKKKTLAFLQKHNVNPAKIYLFVANEEQRELYKDCQVGNIIVAEIGLVAARNFIFNYFPVGKKIVSFDDDVSELVKLSQDGKRLEPLKDLEAFVVRGFNRCDVVGARLWGAYPTPNPFFMADKHTSDLKFIIGSFFACTNPGPELLLDPAITDGPKEDYCRCIQFWLADKKIVRFNDVAVKTATYKTPGGLNTGTRASREAATVQILLQKYPELVMLNKRRKSIFPELLFKRTKGDPCLP